MKTFRLLIVALLFATAASAQSYTGNVRNGDYEPTVYLISVNEVENVSDCCCNARQAAALNRMAVTNATQDYIDTHRSGFQQVEKPQFVFTSKNNRFSFAVGGIVELRAAYGFEGITNRDTGSQRQQRRRRSYQWRWWRERSPQERQECRSRSRQRGCPCP